MMSLEAILSKVFAASTTKATVANKSIMLSCDDRFYFPLFLAFEGNKRCDCLDVMMGDDHCRFHGVKVNLVSSVKEGGVYLLLSFDFYHSTIKHLTYEEMTERFHPLDVVDFDTYRKYENEFRSYGYEFELNDDMTISVASHR